MVQSMPGEVGLWLRDSRVARTSWRRVAASEYLPCFVRAAPRLSFSARLWSLVKVFAGVGWGSAGFEDTRLCSED